MKKFKKLIPAFCMLLISAVLMGTSTYAWFSMNRTVTANGMEVTAKSNSEYLLIGAGNAEVTAIQDAKTTTIEGTYAYTTTNANKAVYPVAYYEEAAKLGETTTEAKSFYTANSNKPDKVGTEADATIENVRKIEITNHDYILKYTVKLVLSKDSTNAVNKKIKLTPTYSAGADAAVKAVVVIGGEYIALDRTAKTTANTVALDNTAAVDVAVYVYVDGNSANITSDYINTPKTISGTLSLQFDLVD